jgi:hypothetical protein
MVSGLRRPPYCDRISLLICRFFLLAFFGPLLVLPGDPLPFWGIFVTGPLGAVVGLITFVVAAFRQQRHQ